MQKERETLLLSWVTQQLKELQECMAGNGALIPVSGDASFRRYFRVITDNRSLIAVDAPPEHENNEAFVKIDRILEEEGLLVPHIIAVDFQQGFLLLTDLGDQLLLPNLNDTTVEQHYQAALGGLDKIHGIPKQRLVDIPDYDQQKLLSELELFPHWFVGLYCGHTLSADENTMLEQQFSLLIESALNQPQVLVHRDYHSRNLMLQPDGALGVIDFQDAVVGAFTYDLVSLIKDCYIRWPSQQVEQWALQFLKRWNEHNPGQSMEREAFLTSFHWMGLQRHLKVLGIFCRLYLRDDKPGFLNDLPLIWNYAVEVTGRYEALSDLHVWLTETLYPLFVKRQPAVADFVLEPK